MAAGLSVVGACPRVTGCRVCGGSGPLDSRLVVTGWTENAKMAQQWNNHERNELLRRVAISTSVPRRRPRCLLLLQISSSPLATF